MLIWEKLQASEPRHEFTYATFQRTPVPGGWILSLFWSPVHGGGPALCFYPDPNHLWDGRSLNLAQETLADKVLVH